MNQKEIKELIEFLKEKGIAEFELERGDVRVKVKWAPDPAAITETRYMAVHPAAPPIVAAVPVATSPAPVRQVEAAPEPPAAEAGLHGVRSPIVGTFYEA